MEDVFTRYLRKSNGNKMLASARLAASLMAGDRATVKQGYTLGNALLAVADGYNLTRTEVCLAAERIEADRKAVILVETSGGIATETILRGDARIIDIDWDNVEEQDSLGSNLDELENAEAQVIELRELVADGNVDSMDQRVIDEVADRLSRYTQEARARWAD